MGTRSHCETAVEMHIRRMLISFGVKPDEHEEKMMRTIEACVESVFDPAWQWGKECANEELEDKYTEEVNRNTAARAVVVALIEDLSPEQMPYNTKRAVDGWKQSYISGEGSIIIDDESQITSGLITFDDSHPDAYKEDIELP